MSPFLGPSSFLLNKRDVLRKSLTFLIITCFPGFFHILIFHLMGGVMNKFCIVVLLIACSIAANPQFSLEVNAGVERAAAHLKVLKYIDKNNRWSLYSGNHAAVNYDKGKPGFISANIFAYNFRSGIGISTVLIAGKNGLHPSAGLQYQKTIRSFYFYFLSTIEPNKVAKQENYFFLVYKHKLSNRVKFVFHNEIYISFRKWGYDQSLQRIKSGLEIRQTQTGIISETSQTGKSFQTRLVNLGCFITQSF
jgi:hypothetical protein